METKDIVEQYNEIMRYMENAREILSTKAKKKDGYYQDAKYVKMACGTAYSAVLMALDAHLGTKVKTHKPKSNHRNTDYYRRALSNDRKMLNYFNDTWESLHCAGYYNGILNAKMLQVGFDSANAIIKAIRPTGKTR